MNCTVIGLGTMGSIVAQRLIDSGHKVSVYDIDKSKSKEFSSYLVSEDEALSSDIIWLMLPAGKITNDTVKKIASEFKKPGKIVIDGGNSFYKDSIASAELLKSNNMHFIDCGVSGGILGLKYGFCLMVGGEEKIYQHLEPIFKSLAFFKNNSYGYNYVGPAGAGHYVKMVHNGIEYGLLQAYSEGFSLLHNSPFSFNLSLVSNLWHNGSLISGTLLNLFTQALGKDWQNVSGKVGGGQTGTWTFESAQEANVSMPVLETSLAVRNWSQHGGDDATKLVALVRNLFGTHKLFTEKQAKSDNFWLASSGMNLIDVSWPISEDMTTYKDRRDVKITELRSYPKSGVAESALSMNLHTGTHVDAPKHMSGGDSIEGLLPDKLIGNCTVIDCTNTQDKITVEDLGAINTEILFLKTSNSLNSEIANFNYNLVTLSPEAAKYLVDNKVKIVGVDGLSVEKNDPEHKVHKILFDAGIYIIEGLRLAEVKAGKYTAFVFPLLIKDADAGPARVLVASLES